jgi:isocitrate dehydrogenase
MSHHPFSTNPGAPLPPSAPALVRERTHTRPTITVAPGDGIGPEITDAVLRVLDAAGVDLDYERVTLGESVYRQGVSSGIPPEAWETIRRHRILLKAPITTPQGGGFKSVNVTLRKSLGLFANVRPCPTYSPYVPTLHPGMDLVIVRENEEDTYGGIEHRQTAEVTQCLKLITRPGTERIVRYAFAYARSHGRRKVTCLTKDNIMKITDGLFHRIFDEIRRDYPEIEAEHLIIDIGTARLATVPQNFDVVVTLNLYGDILSDVAAQISGSVGLAGSANIGPECAMFEAVHGSAPDIAGRGLANPSGLLTAAVLMLVHLGRAEAATRIHNAWLRTLEDGVHTTDIANEHTTRERVGTAAFAEAVVARLGSEPEHLRPVRYEAPDPEAFRLALAPPSPAKPPVKSFQGVDVFLDWSPTDGKRDPVRLADALGAATPPSFRLSMITNRGARVWPDGFPETFCTDHWRCRFLAQEPDKNPVRAGTQVAALLTALSGKGFDTIKTENLYAFDGVQAYSRGQGE